MTTCDEKTCGHVDAYFNHHKKANSYCTKGLLCENSKLRLSAINKHMEQHHAELLKAENEKIFVDKMSAAMVKDVVKETLPTASDAVDFSDQIDYDKTPSTGSKDKRARHEFVPEKIDGSDIRTICMFIQLASYTFEAPRDFIAGGWICGKKVNAGTKYCTACAEKINKRPKNKKT
jgi:hypothetical protein